MATVGSSDAYFHSMIGAVFTMINEHVHSLKDLSNDLIIECCIHKKI